MSRPTVVDGLCTNDFKLSLDVWVKVLDEVEMVRQFLPLDQIVDAFLVSDIAFAPDIGEGLNVGMDRCQ
jgi:hypothetical protein